jgi:hypothetical protein
MVVVGLMVIGKVMDGPLQVRPLNARDGFTVISEVATEFVLELTVVNTGIFPLPDAASPIVVLAFAHAKVVFGTALVKAIAVD